MALMVDVTPRTCSCTPAPPADRKFSMLCKNLKSAAIMVAFPTRSQYHRLPAYLIHKPYALIDFNIAYYCDFTG